MMERSRLLVHLAREGITPNQPIPGNGVAKLNQRKSLVGKLPNEDLPKRRKHAQEAVLKGDIPLEAPKKVLSPLENVPIPDLYNFKKNKGHHREESNGSTAIMKVSFTHTPKKIASPVENVLLIEADPYAFTDTESVDLNACHDSGEHITSKETAVRQFRDSSYRHIPSKIKTLGDRKKIEIKEITSNNIINIKPHFVVPEQETNSLKYDITTQNFPTSDGNYNIDTLNNSGSFNTSGSSYNQDSFDPDYEASLNNADNTSFSSAEDNTLTEDEEIQLQQNTNSQLLKEYIRMDFSQIKAIAKVPGPPQLHFFLGNISTLRGTPAHIFCELRKWGLQYYPIYKLHIGYIFTVSLLCPEDFELVLSNMKHITKSDVYVILTNWLRTGLLTSTGEKWQLRRKILTPAFHFSMLHQFVSVFNEEAQSFAETLEEECERPIIEINKHVTQFTLKTIAQTAMGTELDPASKEQNQYKNAILELFDIQLFRVLRPLMYITPYYIFSQCFRRERKLLKILHTFTRNVIRERKQNFKGIEVITDDETVVYTSKRKMAMLDLLLSVQKEEGLIDEEGIREEVDTFMFEGHDTTAAAIGFALMLLACNKDAQNGILEEMRQVLGANLHKKPSYKELHDMKFLERCIKEVLRMYPSVHYISRTLGEDLVTHDGTFLPKNTMVHLHIYDLHHNPKIYPDPEKFDPDRFLPENSLNRHPFAYVPFSAGPRNCIGQRFALLEIKAVLCAVLANFILEPVDTPETIVMEVGLILRTTESIKVKFVARR